MAVYLDHNASTPMLPEVLDAMLPFLQSTAGNASSLHQGGRFLRSAIETARAQVAQLINANPEQVVFTSGGTEANNLAIKGMLAICSSSSLITTPIEHASVLQPFKQMVVSGCVTHYCKADVNGTVNAQSCEQLIDAHAPDLVSVQLANNETGVIQPVERIARHAHSKHDCLVHTDATQAIGKISVDMQQLDVDLLTLSGHKFYGPQGVGALIIKAGGVENALLSGGPQESGRRAGTENVALLVGLGKAAELAAIKLFERQTYLLELRRYFEQQLESIDGLVIFGNSVERLPNTSFFSIPYYQGETLLMQLDKVGFELASGSACHSEVTQPSHVLGAMGIDEALALNAVRVSFGLENTTQQIDQLVEKLNQLIKQLPAVMRQASG